MKYKVGDKVKINRDGEGIRYTSNTIKELEDYNYIFTIEKIEEEKVGHYIMKETGSGFPDQAIKELVKMPQNPNELIESRFEILDL